MYNPEGVSLVLVDGEICVDFPLAEKKNRWGMRISPCARKAMIALMKVGSCQTHNKAPKSVFRLWTPFSTDREAKLVLKKYLVGEIKFKEQSV